MIKQRFFLIILKIMLGIKDEDFALNSQLMWLRGDGDRGIQSMNFQGLGVGPWMQPPSMLGLQNDMYQAMAAAALREMRGVDTPKPAHTSLLQFQQPQNLPSRSTALMQQQMLQQPFVQDNPPQPQSQAQTQAHLLQSQSQAQSQADLLQQPQLQHAQSFTNQQQQVDHQQGPSAVSTLPQFSSVTQSQSSPPPMQSISQLCHQQSFSDSNGTSPIISPLHSLLGSFTQDESSHLINLPRSTPLITSPTWPSKRVAVESHFPSGGPQCVLPPQVDQLGPPPQTNVSQNPIALPPFPGRECSIDQESNGDPQSHLLFGVNIEPSSLLMQNEMSSLGGVAPNTDSTTLPFASNFMSTAGTDFPVNPTITPSMDESGFLQSPETVGQGNPPTRTFVKVSDLLDNKFHTYFITFSLCFSRYVSL